MDRAVQAERARRLRALHDGPRLLILPNIWDPLGARLLADLGFPAVATASAAVAWSRGYADGQRLRWDAMLEAVERVVDAVDVPVTADIEAGYADAPDELAAHVRDLLGTGAVGINLEDSRFEGERMFSIAEQQERLRAVRAAADELGIPLVLNARTDVFIAAGDASAESRLAEGIDRGRAYLEAGADCIYPILLEDLDALRRLRDALDAPINVYASASAPSIRALEAAGIRRLSLGPGLLKASLKAMKDVAETLLHGGSYESFTRDALSSAEIEAYIRKTPMP